MGSIRRRRTSFFFPLYRYSFSDGFSRRGDALRRSGIKGKDKEKDERERVGGVGRTREGGTSENVTSLRCVYVLTT